MREVPELIDRMSKLKKKNQSPVNWQMGPVRICSGRRKARNFHAEVVDGSLQIAVFVLPSHAHQQICICIDVWTRISFAYFPGHVV
jgi:hypothetical protein